MQKIIKTKTALNETLIIKIRCSDESNGHNGHDSFAITATLYEANKPAIEKNFIQGGCIHEEILKTRPDLKPFVDLHLSDGEGIPMYALENGFYFYKENGINHAGDYLRLTREQKIELEGLLVDASLINANRKEVFASYVEKMKPIWKAEADKAKELLNSL